jgi:histidinol-phosphate aminotransferase
MDYLRLARPPVRTLTPYRPGTTIDQAKREFGLEHVVKLSSNENPLGPSPKAMAALASIPDAHLYADDDHTELKTLLAAPFGLSADETFVGHGSNDILMTFFATFVAAGDEVVMADPTFSLFPAFARIFDARVVEVPLREGAHDLEAMAAAVTPKTKAVVVCDPNNPSSTCVDAAAFARFVAALPPDVLLLVDQAYREYTPPSAVEGVDYVKRRPGTIVTRTMSKAYGLASIRFGYAFADREMIALMQRVRVPFNLSRPAAIAARAALGDTEFLARTIATNESGRALLNKAFARLGLFVYPSAANFVALRVPTSATVAYTDLLQRGVVTRSGDALHFPGFLRITIGTPEENAALIAAIEDALPNWRAAGALSA